MRLIKRLRNGKSVLSTINKAIDQGSAIAKEAIVDKDKFIALEHDLQKIRAELLLSGLGSSITKYTICGLVSLVVGILSWVFLFKSANMLHAVAYAAGVTPLIGILIGVYGTKGGKTFQKNKD